MLITIISLILFILGIILYRIKDDSMIAITSMLLGSVATLVCLFAIAIIQIPREYNYQKALYEKEDLEYRHDQDKHLYGDERLYSDIQEYNKKLMRNKYFADNIWVNWFFNDKIAEIEYVEVK